MQRRFLIFSAAGWRFALNLKDVAEVMEPRKCFPLPVAPDHFLGLIDFHGTLTAVLDFPFFLGRGKISPRGKLLVLDGKLASLALWVDGVGSIVSEEAVVVAPPSGEPLVEARLETEWGEVSLLNLEALLTALEAGVPQ